MCMWVHAMDQYADVFEAVKPRMDTVQVLCSVWRMNGPADATQVAIQ